MTIEPSQNTNRPTMADVARACGIARSTVSGILNQRADCYASEETRQRVRETVRRMGYRPSRTATGLASGRTATLGLVHTGADLESPVRICMAFERRARERGYMTVVAFNPNDPTVEDHQLDCLDDRGVDGVFVMPSEEGRHAGLRRLAERGVPVVTLDAAGRLDWAAGLTIDDVSYDSYRGGRMQAEHLIALGRRRLVIANSFHGCFVTEQRMAGMADAAVEAGLPEPVRMDMPFEAHPVDRWPAEAERYVTRFFSERVPDADGLMGTGDQITLAVAGSLMRQGWSIPGDIAAIGHDYQSFSAMPMLPLSSISIPTQEIGAVACDLLLKRLETGGAGAPPRHVKIQPRLVQQLSSVGPESLSLTASVDEQQMRPIRAK